MLGGILELNESSIVHAWKPERWNKTP